MMNREATLQAISQNPNVSVLIVGAGINGIGTFRDLALQGIDVLLVDRGDFCSGASAASSHMVHGGIRYLENGEFRLVQEAVRERNRLLQNAPHYVKPLATTIPIFKRFSGMLNAPLKFLRLLNKPGERGALVIKAGLMMYDAFTRSQGTVPAHEFASRRESLRKYPQLNPHIQYTATYYDAAMPSPERIALELVLDGEQATPEAKALNYVSVTGAAGDMVMLRDELTAETISVRPKIVINAAGPWIDFANETMDRKTNLIGGTKGSHLVLDHPELHQACKGNEFFFENDDGRIVLIYPLLDKVLIGTSDLPIDDPDQARCTDAEIDYFLGMIKHVFPSITVGREHIVFTFSGVRPLPASDAASAGQISRDHSVKLIEPSQDIEFPIYALVGGKWTTFRAFSEQVTDIILQRLEQSRQVRTTEIPIGGGRDYPRNPTDQAQWIAALEAQSGLARDRLQVLLMRYGTRAADVATFIAEAEDNALQHQPDYSRREIAFLVREERVVHLDDLLLRRTLLAMLGKVTADLVVELAEIVGERLGWSEEYQEAEIERVFALLAEKHRVELAQPDLT